MREVALASAYSIFVFLPIARSNRGISDYNAITHPDPGSSTIFASVFVSGL